MTDNTERKALSEFTHEIRPWASSEWMFVYSKVRDIEPPSIWRKKDERKKKKKKMKNKKKKKKEEKKKRVRK